MTTDINELYNRHIRNHLAEHYQKPSLPFSTLQLSAPDLSCLECYPPPRTSGRIFFQTSFRRFWRWYSGTYHADTYSGQTTSNFARLTSTRDSSTIRACIRDIIFSCRYQVDIVNPGEIALAILQRYANRTILPPVDFDDYTVFDYYLDPEPESYHRPYNPYPDFGSSIADAPTQTLTTTPFIDTFVAPSASPNLHPLGDNHSTTSSHSPQIPHISLTASPVTLTPRQLEVDLEHFFDTTTTFELNQHLPNTAPETTEENQTPPSPPSTINLPVLNPPVINLPPKMGDQALREAATAINALAAAMTNGGPEKNLLSVNFFNGDGTQDPLEWYTEFKRAATANRWNPARKLELVPVYLKGIALDWYSSLANAPTVFSDANNAARSFKYLFKDRFITPKQKALWQKQLFEIKQGANSVDEYINQFRKLKKRVDPDDAFPGDFLKQLFIQGLRPEFAINVQASEPNNLATAMDTARKWEIGKLIASPNTDTDKAIKQLTDQIAQLSINLAQKQQPPNLSVNYADSPKQANPIKQPSTCHYCGRTGHFIAYCRDRKSTKIENEEETDNLTITTIANETHIEIDPEAEIIIIGTEIIIIKIEVVQEIEIIEMTEMTTALEVVIDPLTLHGDPLIVPLTLL